MAVEYLLGRGSLVCNAPVEDRRFCDHADSGIRYPFPEQYIFVVDVRLDFLLGVNVENLQSAGGCIDSY